MTKDVTSYKCPGCSAPLDFHPQSQRMLCNSCGTSYDISDISFDDHKDCDDPWSESDVGYRLDDDGKKVVVVSCPSCSAELMYEHQMISTECPYCDNNIIINDNIKGSLRPDYIIPFEVTEEVAVEAFRKFYQSKPLTPLKFRKENKVQNIKGLYVPFWMFSGRADADMSFSATRTKRSRISSSKTKVTTDKYRVDIRGEVPFELLPVDASVQIDNSRVELIEPYNYEKLCAFDTAYMSGHAAEKFDVPKADGAGRVNERVSEEITRLLKEKITGYDSVSVSEKNCKIELKNTQYALMPLYLLRVSWNGRQYEMMINGQTGKVSGKVPLSIAKVALLFVLCVMVRFAVTWIFML